MKRIAFFLYGILCYLSFLAVFLYAVGFLGNFGVPNTSDGQPWVPVWQALAINTVLLGVFAVQHSLMARQAFKQWWTQYIPKPIERSTYVLCTNIALGSPVLFLATHGRKDLARSRPNRAGPAVWCVCGRLGLGSHGHIPHQSF